MQRQPPATTGLPGLDAVLSGIEPGAKIVVEGAQNLRPGSLVSLGERKNAQSPGKAAGGAAGAAKAKEPS